jgi:D-alanyl-D-alanine carboxypeptidase/D-alanyl-D-alanine-endopeptidase (penicillin-binding protein 4)
MRLKRLGVVLGVLATVAFGCARPVDKTYPAPQVTPASQPALSPDTARLSAVLHRLDETKAVVSARVIELPGGRELYADNCDSPVIPASNLKLSVSAAVLDRFGPDHRLMTYLAIDGDNLWLIGTGDPATGDPKIAEKNGEKPTTMLDRWAEALLARGVREFKGNLYYDDRAFDDVRVHPTWSQSFLTDWYAAPVEGLNFNDNCIDVTVRPAGEGRPAVVEVVPPTEAIQIVNRTVSGATGAAKIARKQTANVFTLSGGVKKETKLESKPVIDPGAFFADALRTNLKSHGIVVRGEILRAERPLGDRGNVLASHATLLRDVLWRIDKNSQNLFAEAMAKYLGRAYEVEHGNPDARGSWESGAVAIREFLRRQGVDDSKFMFVDGSGLARGNLVTTRGQTQLLLAMSRHRYADVFSESLGVSGVDGTIGKRMTDIAGRVHAKTGSIRGVRSLSGNLQTRGGRWLAFSIIYNDIPDEDGDPGPKAFEKLADDCCREMVGW